MLSEEASSRSCVDFLCVRRETISSSLTALSAVGKVSGTVAGGRREHTIPQSTRRDFLKTTIAGAALFGAGAKASGATKKRSATDWVTLGKSNVKVTRLAFGTGTHGGRVQRGTRTGIFTRLVRHAYDRGIRFFETAESYPGMPEMLSIALKGVPRDTYGKLMDEVQDSGLRATSLRKSISSAVSSIASTSIFFCCIACGPSPGRPTIRACRMASRRRNRKRSF